MSTTLKEWLLKTIAELEEERDATPGAVNEDAAMALAAMKLALASLEAEPVAYMWDSDRKDVDAAGYYRPEHKIFAESSVKRYGGKVVALYAAPPAPAVDADEVTAEDCPAFVKYDVTDVDEAWARGFNACRAAMLHGAEPVTTANKLPFEQWLSQQTVTIDVECGCVMTEVFFHWLRVAYEAGNSPVIPDGWVLVPKEPTTNQWAAGMQAFDSGMDKVTRVYKAMLGAAPKQEAE